MCSSGGQTLEPENIMWKDQKNRHGKWYSGGSSWGKQRRQRGRRPGHRTEYSAHVFNVKTSPAGSCSIFPQSTWAPCPKRWDFLCIQVTGCTQWPVSHGLGQNFDGGAGSRCPAVFSTGYGAHQGKKTGVLGAHAFFVLGTVPIKKKTSSGKTSSKQTLQGSSWTVQS